MAAIRAHDDAALLLHPGVQEVDGITLRVSRSFDPFDGWSPSLRTRAAIAAWALVVLTGVLLGVCLPHGDARMPHWAATASAVVGWTYFSIWTVSFYPQLYENYRRQSVVGLSFDFVLYNWISFICYAAFSCALSFSPGDRQAYRDRHDGHNPGVRLNDVFFAVHASLAGAAMLAQIAFYDNGSQTLSTTCKRITAALGIGLVVAMAVSLWPAVPWEPLDFFYLLGYIKVIITVIKYMPQVLLSAKRKSTDGFAIGPVLCDFTGGILSIAQQIFDSVILKDPAIVWGNLVKFGIGWVGICYNIIMITQHYILYPDVKLHDTELRRDAEPLLGASDEDAKHDV